MKNIKFVKYMTYMVLIAMGLSMSSCTPPDDYKKYLEEGAITYPGKIKSVTALSGYKRIKLDMVLSSDPAVKKILVYWKNRQESATMDVDHTTDTVELLIENIDEGFHNFEIFTFDEKGNSSVVTNVSGTVFGDTYVGTLLNRILLSFSGCHEISWGTASENMTGVELTYTNLDGGESTVIVDNDETTTILADVDIAIPVQYRTSYLPNEGAIDTFYSETKSLTFPAADMPLEGGIYKVTSITVTGDPDWAPKLGDTRLVTKISDTEFSFQLVTRTDIGFSVAEAGTLLVDPVTNVTSIAKHLSSKYNGDSYHVNIESVTSDDNYVSTCEGIISYKVHGFSESPPADNAYEWGVYTCVLTKQP